VFALIVAGPAQPASTASARTLSYGRSLESYYADSATDDRTIQGCTAIIASGRE
jgi:uncharacterized protein (DUF697 family)